MITKVEISQDQADFLVQLASELTTQDNLATRLPLLFVVKEDEFMWYDEPCNGETDEDNIDLVAVTPDGEGECYNTVEDFQEHLDDYESYDNPKYDKVYQAFEMSNDMEEFKENLSSITSWREESDLRDCFSFYYRIRSHRMSEQQAHVFFTKKAADRFIRSNKHNLNNPTVFVHHAYRNPEMESVHEVIMDIAKQIKTT